MNKSETKSRGVHYDRTVARRKAVQLLYQAQILGQPLCEVLKTDTFIEEIGVLPEYARMLISGLSEQLEEVDTCLSQSSDNWSLDRMPLVDRCILRLAVYEMRFVSSVPVSVTINEAIELAHEFGGEDGSGSFVNGVLGNIARSIQAPEEDAAASQASTLASVQASTQVPAEVPAEAPTNMSASAPVSVPSQSGR